MEEIVELGFEGVDRFATHYHDPVVDKLSKHKPFAPRSKKNNDSEMGHRPKERQRELSDDEKPRQRRDSPQGREPLDQQYMPPHPQWQAPPPPSGAYLPPPPGNYPPPPPAGDYPPPPPGVYPPPPPAGLPHPPFAGSQSTSQRSRRQLPRQRSYSDSRDERYDSRSVRDDVGELDSDSDERGPRSMYSSYAPDRRRDNGRRDDDRYEESVDEREYDRPRGKAEQVVVRSRDANRYQGALARRAPSPDHSYTQRGYADGLAIRGRPAPRRQRSSSWSPPRRAERRHESAERSVRSKSPKHYSGLAMVLGALAGGVAGSRVKKSDVVPNAMATVGGAILGGLAGREAEQEYDRHKTREKRRMSREYNYD